MIHVERTAGARAHTHTHTHTHTHFEKNTQRAMLCAIVREDQFHMI